MHRDRDDPSSSSTDDGSHEFQDENRDGLWANPTQRSSCQRAGCGETVGTAVPFPATDVAVANRDGEPAEPSPSATATIDERDDQPLAYPAFDPAELPNPLQKCGCGECDSASHPLDREEHPFAADCCPSPTSLTVGEAREAYRRYKGAEYSNEDYSGAYGMAVDHYRRILEADRRCLADYESPTTVLVSLRLSPTDQDKERFLPPLRLDANLHSDLGDTVRRFRRALSDYGRRKYEYVRVTTGTEGKHAFGTPHVHLYGWTDDANDDVSVADFNGVVSAHVESTPTAYPSDHAADGETGAITVQHDPETVTASGYGSVLDGDFLQSVGGRYVARQVVHLRLADLDREDETVTDADLLAGATAWASPNRWFAASRGV